DGSRGGVMGVGDGTEEVAFDRLKREVLAALAHEFKTPVAIVKGYAQHMSKRPDTIPAERPMVAAIERASNRLQKLIDDLVEVSGISLGRLVLNREPVELTAMLRSVAGWGGPDAAAPPAGGGGARGGGGVGGC